MANQQDQILIPRHTFERRLFAWLAEQGYQVLQFHQRSQDAAQQSLFFHIRPGDNRVASGQTCLLLHGTGFDALFPMAAVIHTLASAGHEIFSFDLPGHGFYSKGNLDHDSTLTYMDSALASINAKSVFGTQHLTGVGFSLGGIMLAEAATRHSNAFQQLVLVGSPSHVRNTLRFVGESRFFLQKAFWEALEYYPLIELLPSAGSFRRKSYPIRLTAVNHSFAYIEAVREAIDELYRRALTQAPVDTPCLWLGSYGDGIAPVEQISDYRKIFNKLESRILMGLTHYNLLLAKETASIIGDVISLGAK